MRRENKIIIETLINKMFEISENNITFNDIKDRKDEWYTEWTMTEKQCIEWMEWGADYLRKSLKINKKVALKEMAWINLGYGLKISE